MYGRFGGGGGGGIGFLLRHGDDQARPQINRALLRRVLGYARPYAGRIALLFVGIVTTIGLGLLTPLILRDLIDTALPQKDAARLNLLAAGLVAIPVAGAALRVWQRKLDATIGSRSSSTCARRSTPTCSACRSASLPATRPANR